MRVSHHPDYSIPLPDGHPFPMNKYGYLRQFLLERGTLAPEDFVAPGEASMNDLARVHSPEYLEKLVTSALSPAEQRRLGVPWSARLWRRSRLAVQGTLDAARRALAEGISANLAGGTHHAFTDRGEGFCVLNDVAIAIRALQAEAAIDRALIVDLDVHQGNGTAQIFSADASVYALSIHGERNYPATKMRSSLDVALPDGTGDALYLAVLRDALARSLEEARADIVFYLAGVDVAAGDRYGRFALSDDGIRQREEHVISTVRSAGLPLVITLAGGYAPTPERTAQLHVFAIETACRWTLASRVPQAKTAIDECQEP